MVFVKAQAGPPLAGDPDAMFTVHYFDEKGNLTLRSSGSRAWRCNNPGNLHKSPYSMSKKRRAIGFAGDSQDAYAVYPDKETGHEALIVMLKGSIYSPKTLRAALEKYEPNKKDYADIVARKTGLDPDRTIKSLTDAEFESFWKAIEFVERWTEGKEDFIEKRYISGVRKKRGVIVEYLVCSDKESVWMSKQDAIKLTIEGRLHAILVHQKNGNHYLRPEYGQHGFSIIT
jgi:hypothetical protein